MHGCSSGSALLVNAEVDSMGGVIDGGAGIGLKTSPRRAAIEKAQADLRQEYDVREERRRELEFLEKGGNPLDFKFGNAASVSVQSTSLTDQHPEQFVTSEAKGSFALTASPHGDSVDSSGKPGIPSVSEPNTADNLLLFDAHNDPVAEKNPIHPSRRNNIVQSEQSSQVDGAQNAKESEDSAIVRPYARRNRSRSNRDGARSNATDIAQSRGGQGSTFPVRGGSRDAKTQISDNNNNLKLQNPPSVSNLKSASSNGDLTPEAAALDNQLDRKLDGARITETNGLAKSSLTEIKLDVVPSKKSNESHHNHPSQVGSQKTPDIVSRESDVEEKDQMLSASLAREAEVATKQASQRNGFSELREDKSKLNEVENIFSAVGTKVLASQSSGNQSSLGLDVHKNSDACTGTRDTDANGILMRNTDAVKTPDEDGGILARGANETEPEDGSVAMKDNHSTVCPNQSGTVAAAISIEDVQEISSALHKGVSFPPIDERGQLKNQVLAQTDAEVHDISKNPSSHIDDSTSRCPESLDVSMHEVPKHGLSTNSTLGPDLQANIANSLKVSDKAHEDSILEEARIIQAKHKRIAELSVRSSPPESRRKSHWDFVLEEMAWLANDFAQERLWKRTAAAQIGHRVAYASRLRVEQQHDRSKLQGIAHELAKAVIQFWHSAEEPRKDEEVDCPKKDVKLTVRGYAARFLEYNSSLSFPSKAEAPATPERLSDLGIQDMSWDDHLTEESLFYTVPSGAMEAYRKSIEAHCVQFEKPGSSVQEEVETSMYEAGTEFGFQEDVFAEDEGETSTYYQPGNFERTKPMKSTLKKRKNMVSYPRSYETGADMRYGQSSMGQQSMMMVKRPANLNVGAIPTKRVRTASRQRVVTPNANVQLQVKTDASSGDTNSFQDDQSPMHGGSQFQKSMEVESVGDFDKQFAYDSVETSVKPKKKKKAKHLGSGYDQGWQMDSNTHNEQRDYSKKRQESHHFDSNGTSGLYMQNAKKPKLSKQLLENTFENATGMGGSIPSPVASQNNISHANKFIKLIGGRDRGRKSKSLKMTVGQPGSGSPWTLFEDQALVVLVHDMGPNWELISDAINSTLHFQCIFRKSKDCKERHKFLMDKSAGDGADSAEDSGSSQPYPSTLPGIPKGSARQLFQRLQEPLEEDTIKSHFDKIIKIGQKQHYRRTQNEHQDLKQIAPVHNSHVMALSQVCPNNLNGVLLTPLDLSDANSSNQDILPFGCQASHNTGLPISNQGGATPALPSGPNSSLQGSSGAVLGNNLPSPSGSLNASARDGRFNTPRASSNLGAEEQQRMQQYNHVPGRNMQQPGLPVPGALPGTDRAVRMLPGGNGVGMISGMNRNMPMSRPGYQGLNSGTMLSSGMPSPAGMHSGNSMIRPREALHMMRPGHNQEHQRQMMSPELQMQGAQGSGQGITPFNGLSAGFPNQTTAPPVPSYPGHPHQATPQQSHGLNSPHHAQHPNHVTGSQQAFALRYAKDRQMQQRYAQQQQFSGSNTLMPHAQQQAHLPVSSNLPNSSQIQSQAQSQPVSMAAQQKHHLGPHAVGRSGGPMSAQMGKQRQRQAQQQHLQQAGRQHPQQRQHLPSQQHAKPLKGVGRGLAQNLPVDPSHINGVSVPPGSQTHEKGEPPIMQMMQGQGGYSGSGINTVQPPKPMVPQPSNHSQLQPKLNSSSAPTPTKQHQQIPSHPDSNSNNAQGQVPPAPSGQPLPSPHQSATTAVSGPSHQQTQTHQKQANPSQQNAQRIVQQNRQVKFNPPGKSQSDAAQSEKQQIPDNANQAGSNSETRGDSSAAGTVPPAAASSQWKPPEHANSGSEGSPSVKNLEPGKGTGPTRQLSGGLPSHGLNVGAQWQQSQQQPPPVPSTSHKFVQQEQTDQSKSQPNQIPLTHQPQQQISHLQAGQGMYMRPANSKPE